MIECDLYTRSRNVILQLRTGVNYGLRRCLICPWYTTKYCDPARERSLHCDSDVLIIVGGERSNSKDEMVEYEKLMES